MKRTLFLIGLFLCVSFVKAQIVVPTQEQLKQFTKTKTIIFLEPNVLLAYNEQMQETAKKHWTITPYEFRTYSKELLDSLRTDPNLSFHIRFVALKKTVSAYYQFLNVTLGSDYKSAREMPIISGMPISYADMDEGTYDYKLGLILRFIEQHVHNLLQIRILIHHANARFYADNMKQIHNKTLYLMKEELAPDVNTEAKIKKIYPYNVKISTAEEIEQIIDNKDPNAVILHQVAPGKDHKKARCWNTILGADDAALYYFNWFYIKKGKRPQGITAKDFKN